MAKDHHKRIVRVDVDQMTYGIEIECLLPENSIVTHSIAIGQRHHGQCLPVDLFPCGWSAESDASLSADSGYVPIEIVSPRLSGLDGLRQVEAVYWRLRQLGARVNQSCGLHVHVGMRSVLCKRADDFGVVVRWVRRLVHLVSVHEPALYALTGERSRINSGYCRSIKPKWVGKLSTRDTLETVQAANVELNDARRDVSRYYTLNLSNLFGSKCTVEFRVFAATLNTVQAIGCIVTALGLCHRAAEVGTSPIFDSKPADWARAGEFVVGLQRTLWQGTHRYGWPAGAYAEYGHDVVSLQRDNARRFVEGS